MKSSFAQHHFFIGNQSDHHRYQPAFIFAYQNKSAYTGFGDW